MMKLLHFHHGDERGEAFDTARSCEYTRTSYIYIYIYIHTLGMYLEFTEFDDCFCTWVDNVAEMDFKQII